MRSRNIKPSTFANEILGTEDPFLTILFAGLWCLADKAGRLEDRPLKINVQVFPYRRFSPAKIEALLDSLATFGFIRRYSVEGQKLIQVVTFSEHQSPHKTEKESKLPAEPLVSQGVEDLTVRDTLSNGTSTEVECIGNQESGIRNQESEKPVEQIFSYWQNAFNHKRATLTLERRNAINGRLKKYTVEQIKLAIDGCGKSPNHMGQNDRGTIYDDIELICRNDTKLEKFIAFAERPTNGNGQQRDSNNHESTDAALRRIGVKRAA
jgi:hypothetical protein